MKYNIIYINLYTEMQMFVLRPMCRLAMCVCGVMIVADYDKTSWIRYDTIHTRPETKDGIKTVWTEKKIITIIITTPDRTLTFVYSPWQPRYRRQYKKIIFIKSHFPSFCDFLVTENTANYYIQLYFATRPIHCKLYF